MTVKEITDKLYTTYGSDTGILFGIKERAIIESIITFTLHQLDSKPEYKYPHTLEEMEDAEPF